MLDLAMFLDSLSGLPVENRQPGEMLLRKGHATGRLYILRQGVVEVLDGERRIAQASTPGTVFGELGVLLDQPHMADVRVVEPSSFYVAHGKVFLRVHREAALHVACILARRLVAVHADLDTLRVRATEAPHDRALEAMVDAADRSLHQPPGDAG